MNKLIIGIMLVVGLCCATEQESWESARAFTKEILHTSTFGFGHYCYVKGMVFENSFGVWCEPGYLVHELPYSWKGYTIDTYRDDSVAGFVFYKKN